MANELEKKEKDKYEDVDPWKLVTEVPKALLAISAVGILAPLGWLLSIFDKDLEPELKRDPKLKILRAIITTIFWDDLNDRELKVACHIINSPWIHNDREKTTEELKKILLSNNLEKNKLLIKKYLDPLSDRQIYVLRYNIFSDPPKETKFEVFKKKKFRKLWIDRIIDTYATNVRNNRNSDSSDEFAPELDKLFSNISLYFSSLYNAILSTDDLSKEFDSLTKNIFEDTDTIYKKAVEEAVEVANKTTVNVAEKKGNHIGPVVSKLQFEKIQELIKKGIDEGATLSAGGLDRPESLTKGYFVRPTVFSDVNNEMTIAKEEIFGPVVSIIPFSSEEEAIEISNKTSYGLTNYVQTKDKTKAQRIARQLRSGMVEINGKNFADGSPFGGYKQSGNGREGGTWGLEEYLEVKSISGWE